ncbi:metallophosphoesterase domain-containing protein 2 [Massarina eburnea CBS 473.64]|uniref:Metallophosphoesterase domain-containing protein 2 n=1 Tax=Massarina eburnea CBS 473.64 TaxID=1395130 RepID=A0A6A6SEB6_9PLEO|nr:metallophosphoesterase domain-containing protein 2 [Massarina eburnea CBS 473.64]
MWSSSAQHSIPLPSERLYPTSSPTLASGMVLDKLTSWRAQNSAAKPADPFEPTPILYLAFRAPVKLLLYHVYRVITSPRSTPTLSSHPTRVVCISDTHNHFPDNDSIPAGDILIHAGDMTDSGSIDEIQRHVNWLASLPHKEIIVISGNHDTYLDPRTRPSLREDQRTGEVDWKRVHYLQHKRLSLSVTVEPDELTKNTETASVNSKSHLLARETRSRKITVYGAPQIPACGPMNIHAFQYPRGMDAWSETVPEDTDILITHTPSKFHRDLPLPSGMGCEHLAAEVKRVKPALHVFGHVHWGAGKEIVWWDGCHEAYETGMKIQTGWTRGLLNPWLWMCVVRVVYRGVRGLIWDRVWGGQGERTTLVNAAQMHGNTGKLGNSVQVVDI